MSDEARHRRLVGAYELRKVCKSFRRHCMPKRRKCPPSVSMLCTTSCTERMYWPMHGGSPRPMAAQPAWIDRPFGTSTNMAWSGGWVNWRKTSGKRRIGHSRCGASTVPSPTVANGRWVYPRSVTGWQLLHGDPPGDPGSCENRRLFLAGCPRPRDPAPQRGDCGHGHPWLHVLLECVQLSADAGGPPDISGHGRGHPVHLLRAGAVGPDGGGDDRGPRAAAAAEPHGTEVHRARLTMGAVK